MAKVTVTIEIEVEELDLFMTSLQSGLVAFSEETKANILKTEIKENDRAKKRK